MTLLPNSEQAGNLDNLAVTRAEFRSEIGVLLEYMAQALGSVSGTYTTEVVDPFNPELQGTPTLEIGAEPVTADSSFRIPTTQWVKKSGRYVGSTAPASPEIGMLWIDDTSSPFTIRAYNGATWDIVSGVASGTRMLFQQDTAPVGWTKDVSEDNVALRVTAGSVSTGGTLDFTGAFTAAIPVVGTVDDTVLTVAQMPKHSHGVTDLEHAHSIKENYGSRTSLIGGSAQDEIGGSAVNFRYKQPPIEKSKSNITIQDQGSDAAHGHTFTGTDLDLSVRYVDVIIAQKN